MSPLQIHSADDPRIAIYRDLPGTNRTRDPGLFIAEGRWLVERLVASEYPVHSILIDERQLDLLPADLPEVPVFVMARELMEPLLGFHFHRGVLACGYRRAPPTWNSVISQLPAEATVVACANVIDQANLGGILRNCAAFGICAVLLSASCADAFSRRVLRVSMGAAFKLPLLHSPDIATDLRRLKSEHGFETVASVLDPAAEFLNHVIPGPRLALVIGNESEGVPAAVSQACERRVTIPMQLETDSLNAAVASGIFLFHLTRAGRARSVE